MPLKAVNMTGCFMGLCNNKAYATFKQLKYLVVISRLY